MFHGFPYSSGERAAMSEECVVTYCRWWYLWNWVTTVSPRGTYRAIAPPVYWHCAAKINLAHAAFSGPPAQNPVMFFHQHTVTYDNQSCTTQGYVTITWIPRFWHVRNDLRWFHTPPTAELFKTSNTSSSGAEPPSSGRPHRQTGAQ